MHFVACRSISNTMHKSLIANRIGIIYQSCALMSNIKRLRRKTNVNLSLKELESYPFFYNEILKFNQLGKQNLVDQSKIDISYISKIDDSLEKWDTLQFGDYKLYKLDTNLDEKIKKSLQQKKTKESLDLFMDGIDNQIYLTFKTLRILAASMARGIGIVGNDETCDIFHCIRCIASQFYPLLFEKHFYFANYWAEILFNCGKYNEATDILSLIVEKCSYNEESRTIFHSTIFLMNRITESPVDCQKQALIIAANMLLIHNFSKPAFNLWMALFSSMNYEQIQMADELINRIPNLLEGESKRLENMINNAKYDLNSALLHSVIELFLRHNMSDLLQPALSALLEVLCVQNKHNSAIECISFAEQQRISIDANVMQLYLRTFQRSNQSTSLITKFVKDKLKFLTRKDD